MRRTGERPEWLVRIRLATDADPIGAGLLCPDGHVLTCAHVVGMWSADRRELHPHERVYVDFQYVRSSADASGPELIEAVVAENGWHPPRSEDDRTGDVAVLRLTGSVPAEAGPAPLRSTRPGIRDHRYYTYGYPRQHASDGIPSRGRIVDHAADWLQLEAASELGQALEEGFSGAPVWDEDLRGVIGIVVSRDPRGERRDPRTGYAIPGELLARYWPALKPHLDLEPVEEVDEAELESLLEIGLVPGSGLPSLAETSIYDVGVSRSKAVSDGAPDPPYSARRVDDELRDLLDTQPFVLAVGDSKSGKSRTTLEMLRRQLPGARLVVPCRNPPDLPRLARTALPSGGDPIVVWLDDLEGYLVAGGLDLKTLDRFARHSPRIVVAATMTSKAYGKVQAMGEAAGRTARGVLKRARVVQLPSQLDPAERAAAESLYPDEDFSDRGIGEQLVAAPELEQRYDYGREAEPAGWSALQIAVDWRRVGLQSSVPREVLEAMLPRYLAEVAQDLDASPEVLDAALAWARKPVAGTVALLRRDPTGPEAYRAFDYIVAYADGQRAAGNVRPIPEYMWEYVIGTLRSDDLLMVTFGALGRDQADLTLRAARAAYERSDDAETQARAALVLSELCTGTGNIDEARSLMEEAADSGVADVVPMAQAALAGMLIDQGRDLRRAKSLLELALASGDESVAPVARLNMGAVLMNGGDLVAARPWLEAALAADDPEVELALTAQLGGLLASQEEAQRAAAPSGKETTEIVTTRRPDRRSAPRVDDDESGFSRLLRQAAAAGRSRMVVPFAQATLGGLLIGSGDIDRARVLLESALNSGNRQVVPLARANLGSLLFRNGDLAGAQEMFEQAMTADSAPLRWSAAASLGWLLASTGTDPTRGRSLLEEVAAADSPEQAARAQCLLGDLELSVAEDLAAAYAAYDRARRSDHPEWGPYAIVGLATVVSRRGDPEAARALLEPVVESGQITQAARAADMIGDLLAAEGDADGAARAYRRAVASDHPLWGQVATIDLALLLFRQGEVDEALDLTAGIVARSDPLTMPWASIQLGDMHTARADVEAAEAAYRAALDSSNPDAVAIGRIGLGNLRAQTGETEAALEWFEQVADGPSRVQAARAADLIGDLLANTDPEGAARSYRRAIDAGSPEWAAQAQVDLAKLYLDKDEDIAAAEPLLAAAAAAPFPLQAASARILLGLIRVHEGDRAAANEEFRLAESVGPPAVVSEARLHIAKIAFETGDVARAEELFEGLIGSPVAADAVREEAEVLLGAMRLRQGRSEDAEGLLFGGVSDEAPGGTARGYLEQGEHLFGLNQVTAAGDFLTAAALQGDDKVRAAAEVGLGMVRLAEGRWEEARALIQPVVDAGNLELEGRARRFLASALVRLDRFEEAREHLLRLVDTPGDEYRPGALLLLGRLADAEHDTGAARRWFEEAALCGDPEIEQEAIGALDELRATPPAGRAPARTPTRGLPGPPKALPAPPPAASPVVPAEAGPAVADPPATDTPTPAAPALPADLLLLLAEVATAEGEPAEAAYWTELAEAVRDR